jgi:hypothetical protein
MLGSGAGKLRGRREMNEAVARVGRRSAKFTMMFGREPFFPLADFIDNGH